MGWTSYNAEFYKNGKVDRKAECDKMYTQKEHNGYPKLTVLKSVMIGSVYYAAVESIKNNNRNVFAAVVLTSTNTNDYYNFSYKDMDESIAGFYDCPKSILDLLTPTDNEHALEWRRLCKENFEKKRNKKTKTTLPVGSVIEYKNYDGEIIKLKKMPPNNMQFKRCWWLVIDRGTYMPSNRIPNNFKII